MSIYEPAEPEEQKFSAWVNPTTNVVTVDAYVGPGVVRSPTNRVRYKWAAGETKVVPAELDTAIHQLDDRGTIIGGLAPQLVKVGSQHVVAPALDVNEQRRKAAIKSAEIALVSKKAAEEALVVASANMAVADSVKDSKAMLEEKQTLEEAAARLQAAAAAEIAARDAIPPPAGAIEVEATVPPTSKQPPKGKM